MKKKLTDRLSLSKETVRALQVEDLRQTAAAASNYTGCYTCYVWCILPDTK